MAIPQPITGLVLRWAINAAGMSPDGVEFELGLSDGTLARWMSEAKQPNLGQLKKLAKLLSRPPSFFFLPKPPPDSSISVRFRKFAGTDETPSQITLDGIALAGRIQKTASWVRAAAGLEAAVVPSANRTENVEVVAERLRDWMDWSTNFQMSSEPSDTAVTKAFRAALEGRGIIVMHLSLDENVTRGFSLTDSIAPVIAINTKDPSRARLFSYAHELVHLAGGSASVCEVHEASDRTERFCNQVAAAILMPEKAFRKHVLSRLGGKGVSSVDDVSAIRSRFKVSLRAAAIRAETLGLASFGLYDRVNEAGEFKKSGGAYVPGNERVKPVVRVDEYGATFIRTIESGVEAGLFKSLQAANLLRLSENEWTSARQLARAI